MVLKLCKDCQAPLVGKDPEPLFHQYFEIPAIQPKVTYFHVHQLTCSRCGTLTRGQVPELKRSSYGPGLEALVGHLTGACRFSKRKIVGFLEEVLGIPISLGMVRKFQAKTTRALEASMAEIDSRIMNSAEPKNMDATGQRVCGRLKFAWVASSPSVVKFGIGSKSRESFDKLVGETRGVITSDRFPGYYQLKLEHWQICWSLLTRDFQAASEDKNETSETAENLVKAGLRMLKSWKKMRDGTRTRFAFVKNSLGRIQAKMRKELEKGSQLGKRKLATLARFLLDHWGSLWNYAKIEGGEPTNNEPERQLRELVIYRKICLFVPSEISRRFLKDLIRGLPPPN